MLHNANTCPTTKANLTLFFGDDYYFTISDGFANSVTSTITAGSALDLSNLQVRLYIDNKLALLCQARCIRMGNHNLRNKWRLLRGRAQTYAMLLAGMGLMGFVSRRKNVNNS